MHITADNYDWNGRAHAGCAAAAAAAAGDGDVACRPVDLLDK